MTDFTRYGEFYANSAGQTHSGSLIPFEMSRVAADAPICETVMEWGYDHYPPDTGKWLRSPNMRAEPFCVPADAVAIRVHVKAKAKTITWTAVDVTADLQVAFGQGNNEATHAFAHQKGGSGAAIEDINSITVDIPIAADGTFTMYRHPTIINSYAQLMLAVTLSGYWKPAADVPVGPYEITGLVTLQGE